MVRAVKMRMSEVHAAESVADLNRALVRLQDIWEEIGIPEEQRVQRTNHVHKHIKGLLDLMISEEEQLKTRLLKSIDTCRKELVKLCAELELPPSEEEDGCSILQLEKHNRTQVELMMEHKKQRLGELKDLISKDQELCDTMCTTPFNIDKDSVPSVSQLETYRAHLDDLTKEKNRRYEEFVNGKRQIILFMNDLERYPETSFELDVMCEDEDAFCLTNDNISALKQLLSQLEHHKAENERCCSEFRTKIKELWERLQIPTEEREALAEHMVNSKKKNIDALKAEVQRLEVLKMKSMESITVAIRAEIALFWERCFYSPEQCQSFAAYYDDNFNEELLSLHEAEVLTLKKYYEEHRELFEGVSKWAENWALYLELDKKASDPSRFNNRGGNLLKEQKQRSELQKSLSKLEKSLMFQIDIWEQENGKEFFVKGQKFLEYVQQQWDLHHTEKEKEKMERQMKKIKQTQEDMLYGTVLKTPSKRKVGGTVVPGKARKLNSATISTPSSFLTSGLCGTICPSPLLKLPPSGTRPLKGIEV
ncbi:protein regulator of cytokinesis 1-like isoform X2 [Thalassophryne amazonica]|uniref:protein regulator of cytokinesis 1-like isoform X2 n=1 Tax=Thalassophryne amazonica TaxID=390379 RepID=UPI0014726AAC|nr:protein regulator of cytokinesis 1-like isoform X2 [Thalassophryne amazonica]